MGLQFTINHHLRRSHGQCEGTISFLDLEFWIQQVVRSGAQAYTTLIDGRKAALELDRIGYRRFVKFVDEIARNWHFGAIAVLVSDEHTQAGVHTLGLLTQPTCPVRPFWEAAEAEKWLAACSKELLV